jgi:hypothetical protein
LSGGRKEISITPEIKCDAGEEEENLAIAANSKGKTQ